jgi:hypothetical protein
MLLPYPFYHDKKISSQDNFHRIWSIMIAYVQAARKILKEFFCCFLLISGLLECICDELGFGLLEQMHAQGEALANEYPRQLLIREVVEISILLYMG